MPSAGYSRSVRALRRFTVRAALPEPLTPLSQLVMNLRWSWHPETRDLFETLDPALWQTFGGDPVRALGEVSAERLAQLAKDRRVLPPPPGAVDHPGGELTTPPRDQSPRAGTSDGGGPQNNAPLSPPV